MGDASNFCFLVDNLLYSAENTGLKMCSSERGYILWATAAARGVGAARKWL
jgi:hypothetical protein